MTKSHNVGDMIIIGKNELHDFFKKHAQSKAPLIAWLQLVNENSYKDFNQLRKTFPSADYVCHKYTIFNIAANKYRLITLLNYESQVMVVKKVWTHAEYDMRKNQNLLIRGDL